MEVDSLAYFVQLRQLSIVGETPFQYNPAGDRLAGLSRMVDKTRESELFRRFVELMSTKELKIKWSQYGNEIGIFGNYSPTTTITYSIAESFGFGNTNGKEYVGPEVSIESEPAKVITDGKRVYDRLITLPFCCGDYGYRGGLRKEDIKPYHRKASLMWAVLKDHWRIGTSFMGRAVRDIAVTVDKVHDEEIRMLVKYFRGA